MGSGRGRRALWVTGAAILGLLAFPGAASAQVAPSPNTAKLVAAAGDNPQWAKVAAYIGALCPNLALGTDLRTRCAAALSAAATSPSTAANALNALTPEQVLAQGKVIDGSIAPATNAVAGRISALSHIRIGGPLASNYRPVLLATNGDTTGVGGLSAPRLQAYANLVGGSGSKDDTALETGYDFDQKSITVGADYRFSDRFTGGVSLSYGDTKLNFVEDTGTMSARTWMGTVYGLWTISDHIEVTGLLGYGTIDYSTDHNVDYTESAASTISRIAHSNTSGKQLEGTLTVAYAMSGANGLSYGPSLSVSATRLDLDPFSETGSLGLDWTYQKQSTESLQFMLGFDVSKAISMSFGILSPYARVQAVYEAEDDKRNVDIRYVADTTGFFSGVRLTTAAPDRSRFLLGGGVSGQFASGWSGFADVETTLGFRNVSGYTATLGARREF